MNKLFVVVIGLLAPMIALSAPVPDDLVGEWMFGALSLTNYRDVSTGRLADDGGGIGDKIKIGKDGRYERAAKMRFTLYACTTRLAIWEKGTVEVSAQKISFKPTQGSICSEDSCNAQNNYQKSVSPWSRAWTLGKDGYGRIALSLAGANGHPITYLRQLSTNWP